MLEGATNIREQVLNIFYLILFLMKYTYDLLSVFWLKQILNKLNDYRLYDKVVLKWSKNNLIINATNAK